MGAAAIARWNQHFLLESGESQTMLRFIPLFHALFFFSKAAAIPDHAVRISISSDDEFRLFADNETIGMGDHHDEVYKFYTELEHGSKLRVEAVDIHAESGFNPRSHRGIILSTSQGLVTNAEWRCIENNGSVLPDISDWPFAEMLGNNSANSDWGIRPEILPNASWIWAQKFSSGDYPSKVTCVPPPSSSTEEGSSKCVDNGCEREFDGQGMCVDFSTSSDVIFTSLADQFDLEAGSKSGLCGDQQGECCHCLKKKPEPTTVTPEPTKITPEPTEVTQEPTKLTPEVTQEPTEVTPEPTEVTHKPTKETQKPTKETKERTTVRPEPTEVTPEPTEVTPKTSKITTEPREVKPYTYLIALGGNTVNGTTK